MSTEYYAGKGCERYKECKGHGDVMFSHCEDCTFKFKVGDKVWKPKGYGFVGTVCARFFNSKDEIRYVVEATVKPYGGMLHIYNEEQLALGTEAGLL